MKTNIIVLIALALLSAGLSFFVVRKAVPSSRGSGLEQIRDVSFLVKELALDEGQEREITKLHDSLQATLSDCCARHCAARDSLGVMLSGEIRENGIEEQVGRMTRAYEDSERAVCAHILKVMALLKPGQKRIFAGLITDGLCGGGGSFGCTGMPSGVSETNKEGK